MNTEFFTREMHYPYTEVRYLHTASRLCRRRRHPGRRPVQEHLLLQQIGRFHDKLV